MVPTILFFVVLIFVSVYLYPKMKNSGAFLKKEVVPCYNKIFEIITPYLNTDLAKKIQQNALSFLAKASKQYAYDKKNNNFRDKDLYKELIENKNDVQRIFPLLFVYLHICRHFQGLRISDTYEDPIIRDFGDRIEKEILKLREYIPEWYLNEMSLTIKDRTDGVCVEYVMY